MADKPTYDELCRRYGYRASDEEFDGTKRQPYSVHADSGAEAWTFTLLARERGWIVSDPVHNGFQDNHHVTIWKFGDADDGVEGQYRRG